MSDKDILRVGRVATKLSIEVTTAIAKTTIENSELPNMKEARYSSFDFGYGKDYEDGNMTLEALVDYAKANGEPKTTSGKQELYETILALRCK